MKNQGIPHLLLFYKSTSTYAFNVLTGAIETDDYFENSLLITPVTSVEEIVSIVTNPENFNHQFLLGWSFYSTQFAECFSDFLLIKEQLKEFNVIHIVGGVHATAEPEATLRAGFDFVALGEGEVTFMAFLKAFIENEELSKIPGIATLSEGKLVSTGRGEVIDLNRFPPFAIKHRKFNPIEITRGCIYACKFCQTPFMFKARFRHRTVENICHYVGIMKQQGLTDIRFITPTSLSYGSPDENVNLSKVEELLSSVREVLGTKGRIFFGSFPSEVRPEHVTHDSLRLLKKYVTNNNLIIGAQSGSEKILNSSKRGHNVEVIIEAVRLTAEAGFVPNVDFIFGLPDETYEDVKASLDLASKLCEYGARIHGHTFMPLPGTPYKDQKPGRISPETMRQLKIFVGKGKLYGKWQEQITTANELSKLRKSNIKHKIS